MKTLLSLLAWTGLFLTVVPPLMLLFSLVDEGTLKGLMFAGMICWFIGRIPRESKG